MADGPATAHQRNAHQTTQRRQPMPVKVERHARQTRDEQTSEAWRPLVEQNLPLVKYILGKLSRNLPRCVDRDDLLAAGSLGLMEAAKRFDPARKVPFHSYAIPRIWGAMLDELRAHDWLSTDMRDQVNKLRRSVAKFHDAGIPRPSNEQLAEALGCTVERVERVKAIAHSEPKRTGASPNAIEADQAGLYARVGTKPPPGPFAATELDDRKRVLADAIERLPEREKQVVLLRYREELYLHEIGRILEVSESRVCQIHGKALERLRGVLKRAGL